MNAQEIFDKAYIAVMKQGKPSMDRGTCMYAGPDGLHCAAGHLIPEDSWHVIEGRSWVDQPLKTLEAVRGDDEWLDILITGIQRAHDSSYGKLCSSDSRSFVEKFHGRMANIASEWKLTIPAVE